MRLRDLLPGLDPGAAQASEEIGTVVFDSRQARPGAAFFAIPGAKADGAAFIADARARGASFVVAQAPTPGASAPEGADLLVADVRAVLSQAAARLHPRQPATIAAVTGTSGKTSVAAFLREIWLACGRSAASLGTIGLVAPNGSVYGSLTTPDPVRLHETLERIADEGVTHLAMEASSHGLDQKRLDGARLTAGAFTNLSRDHLDYHASFEDYFAAKMRLFDELLAPGAGAVVHADDEWSQKACEHARARGLRLMTVGAAGEAIRLVAREPDGFSTRLKLRHEGRDFAVRLPLAGAFQSANALVAAGLAIACGEAAAAVFAALESLRGAPGRLEYVGARNGGAGFVDYAHKPAALENAIAALRPFATGRMIVVFGCGGDRDRGKRPIMGDIAARLADVAIVTDDNPRSESPAAIRAEILAGARAGGGRALLREIGDRAEAIDAACAMLAPGDVVLVAGKGHETGQIVGDRILEFSDRAALVAALDGQTGKGQH